MCPPRPANSRPTWTRRTRRLQRRLDSGSGARLRADRPTYSPTRDHRASRGSAAATPALDAPLGNVSLRNPASASAGGGAKDAAGALTNPRHHTRPPLTHLTPAATTRTMRGAPAAHTAPIARRPRSPHRLPHKSGADPAHFSHQSSLFKGRYSHFRTNPPHTHPAIDK